MRKISFLLAGIFSIALSACSTSKASASENTNAVKSVTTISDNESETSHVNQGSPVGWFFGRI